ncbi:hypothetical protein [Candidatus Villigracilis saccharophilus]|uniref:hypothetical protein n=1 Tax=Candidatus Villigracilis saccharophilus TaxID=3140684 RepID=UPI003134971B|nr:hypothetical protein [Anaerolineales bacterium]
MREAWQPSARYETKDAGERRRKGIQPATGLRKFQKKDLRRSAMRGKVPMVGTEFIIGGSQAKAKQLVKDVIHSAEEKGCCCFVRTYDNTSVKLDPAVTTSEQINDG